MCTGIRIDTRGGTGINGGRSGSRYAAAFDPMVVATYGQASTGSLLAAGIALGAKRQGSREVTVAYVAPPVYGAIIYYVVGVDDLLAAAALSAVVISGALGAGSVAAAAATEATNVISIGAAGRLAAAAAQAEIAEVEEEVADAVLLDLVA